MQVTYSITLEDFLEAQKTHRSKGASRTQRVAMQAISWFFLLMIGLGMVMLVLVRDRPVWQNVQPLFIVSVVFLFMVWVLPLYTWRQMYKKSGLGGSIRAEIGTEGIRFESDKFSGLMRWNAFSRLIESDNEFLLYQTPQLFNVVPKRAFSSEQATEFRALATNALAGRAQAVVG